MTPAHLDADLLASVLDHAVDALLRARVMVAGVDDVEVPQDALDEALGQDAPLANARINFSHALSRIRYALGSTGADLVLDLESAANEVGARDADVAFRVGLGRRARQQ